jgi:hypothetical protein
MIIRILSIFLIFSIHTANSQHTIKFDPTKKPTSLSPSHVSISNTTFKGKKALKVSEIPNDRGEQLVRIEGITFKDGIIETEIAGSVAPGAFEGARGFVGISFRMNDDNTKMECLYLRPTNGRSEDQKRRNHSVQYVSSPGYTWQRLRKENPEEYESYVDLMPDEWTKIKIEVKGNVAKLFVHGAEQPTLIINDLKLGAESEGAIGLWTGLGTVGYFTKLKITKWE